MSWRQSTFRKFQVFIHTWNKSTLLNTEAETHDVGWIIQSNFFLLSILRIPDSIFSFPFLVSKTNALHPLYANCSTVVFIVQCTKLNYRKCLRASLLSILFLVCTLQVITSTLVSKQYLYVLCT